MLPTDEELRALAGSRVVVRLTPAGGGHELTGERVGTLDAADGLVVYVNDGQRTHSVHSQHIAEVEKR